MESELDDNNTDIANITMSVLKNYIGNYDKAKTYLNAALRNEFTGLKMSVYQTLYGIAYNKGDLQQAISRPLYGLYLVHKTLGCKLEIVLRPDKYLKKFDVIPLRWIVDRFFTWLYNFRRIALDNEFYFDSSEAKSLSQKSHLTNWRIEI